MWRRGRWAWGRTRKSVRFCVEKEKAFLRARAVARAARRGVADILVGSLMSLIIVVMVEKLTCSLLEAVV